MNYRITPNYRVVSSMPNWPVFIAFLLHFLLLISVIYFGKNFTQDNIELPAAVELWQGSLPVYKTQNKVIKPIVIHKKIAPDIAVPKIEHAQIVLPVAEKNKKHKIIKKEKIIPEKITPEKPKIKSVAKHKTKFNPLNSLDLPSNKGLRQGKGNAPHNQAGVKSGAQDGTNSGHGADFSAYKKEVQIRIRAQAKAPPDTKGHPKVHIVVRLDPSMNVLSARISRSSGDAAYDQAVLDAVQATGRFPPRPQGSSMDLFRQIELIISLPNS